jgi:hypothetical protein
VRLVVTGTREGHPLVHHYLDRFVARWGRPDTIILGDARGVDAQAGWWARLRGVPRETHVADWRKLGLKAGNRRNQAMVDAAEPGDWCLGFPAPASIGTIDCMERARVRGLRVVELPWHHAVR